MYTHMHTQKSWKITGEGRIFLYLEKKQAREELRIILKNLEDYLFLLMTFKIT
jgi:hypothetical protein